MHPLSLFVLTIVSCIYALPLDQDMRRIRIAMRQALSGNSTASSVAAPTSTTSVAAPQSSTLPSSDSSTPKYVVAHHMVGNTFPYTVADWQDDITLAHASGIDGFALNIGSDSWQPQRVADAYVGYPKISIDH